MRNILDHLSVSKKHRALARRHGRAVAFLQLLTYKLAILLLMVGGSFEGGLVEEAPTNIVFSLQEATGCSTLFRADHAGALSLSTSPQTLAKVAQSQHAVEHPLLDFRHTSFSLSNGLCAPLRC